MHEHTKFSVIQTRCYLCEASHRWLHSHFQGTLCKRIIVNRPGKVTLALPQDPICVKVLIEMFSFMIKLSIPQLMKMIQFSFWNKNVKRRKKRTNIIIVVVDADFFMADLDYNITDCKILPFPLYFLVGMSNSSTDINNWPILFSLSNFGPVAIPLINLAGIGCSFFCSNSFRNFYLFFHLQLCKSVPSTISSKNADLEDCKSSAVLLQSYYGFTHFHFQHLTPCLFSF